MSILMQEGRVYTDDDLTLLLEDLEQRETRSSFWMLLMRLLKLR